MPSTDTGDTPSAPARVESEVSLARLTVLRAMYLLIVVGGAVVFLPRLIRHEPMTRGAIPSLPGGMWVLACFGLRCPLQMLPILLFELAWKTIWLVDYGLPRWMAGANTARFREDLGAIALGPILLLPAIPRRYVWRHCLIEPGARWHSTS